MSSTALQPSPFDPAPPAGARPPSDPGPAPGSLPAAYRLRRYRETARRHKWLIGVVVVLGIGAGVGASRFVQPVFGARATILISGDRTAATNTGPIRESGMLESTGWIDVLRSNRVVDSVVIKTRSHIRTTTAADDSLLMNGRTAPEFIAGEYELEIDADGATYVLLGGPERTEVERGALPDSVGRRIGLQWAVPRQAGARTVPFFLSRVRDAAQELRDRIQTSVRERAQFIPVELSGTDAGRTTQILNVWLDEFVEVAGTLKRKRTTEYLEVLESQLVQAQDRLRAAEGSLETLRATALTSPTVTGPIAGGIEATRDPLMREYLMNRLALEEVRRDREALAQMLRDPAGVSAEAISALPAVIEASPTLKSAIAEVSANESKLRTARQFYGEEHASVRDLVLAIDALKRQTIPQGARAALEQLAFREQSLTKAVGSFSAELRRVPERSIEEARRRREVAVAEELYTSVLQRYNEARLTTASLSADVSVFDYARTPRTPTSNPRRTIAVGGLFMGVALAGLLVVLLDVADRRIRHPEQVTHDLRLDVAGFVPAMKTGGKADPLMAAQTVEAFRSLRLRLQHDMPRGHPIRLVVSSPGIGDGKSLISQNLAMSCAEAGLRTLLIDGDVRRGRQHELFGVAQSPGLVDVLGGNADLDAAVVTTHVPNLSLLPCGSRHAKVPELLDRERLQPVMEQLQPDFDVIIADAAPLGAGIDAFALGVVCGSMLFVVRIDHTDVRMAEAKLEILDRLPVRLIGAVLNGVRSGGAFQYYSYYTEYLMPEPPRPTPNAKRKTPTSNGRLTPTRA